VPVLASNISQGKSVHGGGGHGDNDRELDGRFVEPVPEQHLKANQSGEGIDQHPDPIPHPFIHSINDR